ncbi:MAG: hypothetical protein KAZ54_03295 [Candidatus Planktophila sp.]|nr:hypothetical protein [Candidatus Planktophila sp.]
MKKLIAILMGGVVLMGPLSSISIAADNPDEHWTPISSPQGDGWRSLYIGDNTTLNREPSTLYAEEERVGNSNPISYHCANVDSPKCVELKRITANAFLQPCSTSIVTNCIESFYAIDASGNRINAQSPTNYPASSKWDYAGNDALNLPVGGTPTVWTLPGINHGGGNDQYMVQAFATGGLDKPANTKVTNEQFNLWNLIVNVSPVTLVSGRYSQQVATDYTETPEKTPRGVMHPSVDEWRYCAMVGDGNCQKRQAFPENAKFGVKIRLQKKISGWLHGRIYNPDATVTTAADNSQTIEVIASPINVPIIGEWFRWNELTTDIQKYVLDGRVYGGQGMFTTKNQANGNFQEMVSTSGQQSFDALSLWLPQIKDKASANPSTWAFYTLNQWELSEAGRCINEAKDLVGLVTTNATVYAAGTPTFNPESQTLDYKVMAPHLTSKGEVLKGTYDLRIKSDIARCIYGFSKAPIQASLSILSEDGTTQTATYTVNERDGWLSLSANGFTYSSPVIQVKLSQAQPPAPNPTITPESELTTQAAPKPAAKKVTITCLKGTVKKKISAAKPTCPKGYKKISGVTIR